MTAGPVDLDVLDELLRRCLDGDTLAALDVRVQVAALAELLTPATGAPIDTVTEVLRKYGVVPAFEQMAAREIVARLGLVGNAAVRAGCTP